MKTNPQLAELIKTLKKASIERSSKIWKSLAERLERSKKNWYEVNLSRISRYAKENEVIVVPGKVLGSGMLSKKITIAAFSFSKSAEEKITAAKGKVLSIAELLAHNPTGSNVRIIG
ncbi:MAG: 50S ribosomal protein L18e [Candidatus Thermoplasmatota archaeon]|nr:50S ribosomal protein L18e [Candidatus Thermoplasmatota archaeon]MDI6887418.1 50S ribosomal protein L18e [Candidatus Thermoplasmatota archaeon]